MNVSMLDFVILFIMVWCIASSAMRGFVREVLGIITLFAGLILAAFFYQRTAPLFKEAVKSENIALFLAFSAIFVGTLIVGALIVWLTSRFMKLVKLQWFDRLLGAAFGFIRGWVFVAVLLLGLTAFDIQSDRVRNSALAPYFLPGSRVVAVLTPYDLKARFLVGYRAVELWWREQQ